VEKIYEKEEMKNFLLIIVAIVLCALLFPFGILYALFTQNISLYFRGIAESIDQLGNHVMGGLFNQWMLRAGIPFTDFQPYKFGNIDETVSSVLGKNQKRGTLTKSGRWLNRLLNKLDKNHSIDAIEINP